MKWTAILGSLLAVGTLALIVMSAMQGYEVMCEVCVTFDGRTQCREAYGPSEAEATKTATDNACGLLTSGMSNSIRCGNTPPDRITCQ